MDTRKPESRFRRLSAAGIFFQGNDVVVGNRDNAADEGIGRPQYEKQGNNGAVGQPTSEAENPGDRHKAGGAAERADHVKRHPPLAALR